MVHKSDALLVKNRCELEMCQGRSACTTVCKHLHCGDTGCTDDYWNT